MLQFAPYPELVLLHYRTGLSIITGCGWWFCNLLYSSGTRSKVQPRSWVDIIASTNSCIAGSLTHSNSRELFGLPAVFIYNVSFQDCSVLFLDVSVATGSSDWSSS